MYAAKKAGKQYGQDTEPEMDNDMRVWPPGHPLHKPPKPQEANNAKPVR